MTPHVEELIQFCYQEWDFFGNPEINLNGTSKDGRKEYQDGAWQRIADYWRFIGGGYQNLTGKDRGTPWSAAFVSFAFHEAGAGDGFPYSAGHFKYINTAIRNSDKGIQDATLHGKKLKGYVIQPGDLIGYWRGEKKITYENARSIGWYQSHTDIVVEVGDRFAYTIGGNVMNSVTRRQVRLNPAGELVDRKNNWFVAIQNMM
jgi:hypothetical protein